LILCSFAFTALTPTLTREREGQNRNTEAHMSTGEQCVGSVFYLRRSTGYDSNLSEACNGLVVT